MEKNVFIAYDFNGVIEKRNSHEITPFDQFTLIKKIDPDVAFKLMSFIKKHKAQYFCISDLSLSFDFNRSLILSLLKSGNDEYKALAEEFRRDPILKKLKTSSPLKDKDQRIVDLYVKNKDAIFIAFEDNVELASCEEIDNCHQIWVNSFQLLTDDNIQEAEDIINA